MKSDYWSAYLCFFGLPLLALGLVTFGAYQFAVRTGSSPVIGILVGLVTGALIMGLGIAASGTDMTDFAVTSIIVIVLALMLIPISQRAHENNQRRAQWQRLREQKAAMGPHRQTPKHAPQVSH